jgi:hypothetical protein
MLAKVLGAARRYELTGEERYRRLVEFFWEQVALHRSYCTGGTSNGQRWRTEPGVLARELSATTQECCCTYNMLKLTRHVFSWNPETRYADFYERGYINEIMSAINPETGMTTYFKPMGTGYFKLFGQESDTFWCCNGTGMENYTKLNDSLYFHSNNELFVNLYRRPNHRIGNLVDSAFRFFKPNNLIFFYSHLFLPWRPWRPWRWRRCARTPGRRRRCRRC